MPVIPVTWENRLNSRGRGCSEEKKTEKGFQGCDISSLSSGQEYKLVHTRGKFGSLMVMLNYIHAHTDMYTHIIYTHMGMYTHINAHIYT